MEWIDWIAYIWLTATILGFFFFSLAGRIGRQRPLRGRQARQQWLHQQESERPAFLHRRDCPRIDHIPGGKEHTGRANNSSNDKTKV
ncbi:MAG: hypothetical protein GKR89_12295 [Candidatus Latescibacteria bacterium]|nr:hypothetical protein [Candidatus Latescibacterota bacterium]